jgi:hypothetical protein
VWPLSPSPCEFGTIAITVTKWVVREDINNYNIVW